MTGRIFIHTLSLPERIWVDFFRVFFSQKYLLVDEDIRPVENQFLIEQSLEPGNRRFDVLFESDMEKANPNILPCLVIEDTGTAQTGILLNELRTWAVKPESKRDRTDLLRSTYVFHCCSRHRGESRLLASIVSSAVTAFRDALLEAGLHKIDPWSIGKTMVLKADNDEVYVDTPVTVNFSFQERWKTIERGNSFYENYCLAIASEQLVRYVRTVMAVSDPFLIPYVKTTMDIENINIISYVKSLISLSDPTSSSSFVNSQIDIIDADNVNKYLRTSMRVS